MEKIAVIVGRKYGRLTVLREGPGIPRKDKKYRLRTMICKCDCGNQCEVRLELLNTGGTRSCGCLRREMTAGKGASKVTHGLRKHYLYATWIAIRERCGNPNNPSYRNYGARGISMYEPWRQDLAAFIREVEAELGPRPAGQYPSGRPMYTLDRMDNECGNYEPGNLRWASAREQMLNRRRIPALARRLAEAEERIKQLELELGAALAELGVLRDSYR